MWMLLFMFLWQAFCCMCVEPLWMVCHSQLLHYFPSMQDMTQSRQAYVVKNVSKSIVLAFLTPPAFWVMNRILWYQTWETDLITCMGSIYAASDIVAFFRMFRKLPQSTKIHHACVCVFAFINAWIHYGESTSIWKQTAMLAIASAPTFMVNTFLGARHLSEISDAEKRRLAKASFGVYAMCLTWSMAWQAIVMYRQVEWRWWDTGYVVAVVLIYYDDWVLSRYLYRYYTKIQ